MAADAIWYVAYGSNLSAARLQRYLDRCADPTPPAEAVVVDLPHRLFFAHESTVWTGGTAFVDPAHDPTSGTRATAWLLTRAQFRAVLRMENHWPDPVDVDPDAIAPRTRLVAEDGRYGLLLGCESPDERPALTFTTPLDPLPAPNRPAPAYVDTIVAGLVDGHGMARADARAYLTARIG